MFKEEKYVFHEKDNLQSIAKEVSKVEKFDNYWQRWNFTHRFQQSMSADLQGDFGMWSFHMYLPKLSLEKVHLVLKGLRASWGAARSIMITALVIADICEGHLHTLRHPGSWRHGFPTRRHVQPYLCSYGGSGWKWPLGCSSPYSWAPQEAECHHPPPVWGAYEQGQGPGMKTNKGRQGS